MKPIMHSPARQQEMREADSVMSFFEPTHAEPLSPSQISFIALQESEDKALKHVDKYLHGIQSQIRGTSSSVADIAEEGLDGCWFWLNHNESRIGLFIFLIDTFSIETKQIHIIHLSCSHTNQYEACVTAATNYLFEQFPIDQIRSKLTHYDASETGVLEIPAQVNDFYAQIGFKTFKMLNAPGKRVSVIIMSRPEGKEFTN
jgi:hypothetical protein